MRDERAAHHRALRETEPRPAWSSPSRSVRYPCALYLPNSANRDVLGFQCHAGARDAPARHHAHRCAVDRHLLHPTTHTPHQLRDGTPLTAGRSATAGLRCVPRIVYRPNTCRRCSPGSVSVNMSAYVPSPWSSTRGTHACLVPLVTAAATLSPPHSLALPSLSRTATYSVGGAVRHSPKVKEGFRAPVD